MRNTRLIALLNAALMLTGIAAAQTATPNPNTPASQQQDAPPQEAAATPNPQGAPIEPVFWITSVEVLRSTHSPQLDIVRARGVVTSEGWEEVTLLPMTRGTPADGILDLALVAQSPNDSAKPGEYAEVEAIFAIEPGHPFKGVRVRGATNRVIVVGMPGYSAAAAPPKNCADCAGKLFVPKGQTPPASRPATTIVREEELPSTLRIIRESDGVGTMDLNPNRLTILISDKNEILQATWE